MHLTNTLSERIFDFGRTSVGLLDASHLAVAEAAQNLAGPLPVGLATLRRFNACKAHRDLL